MSPPLHPAAMSTARARGMGRLSRPQAGLMVSLPDLLLRWFSLSQGPWVSSLTLSSLSPHATNSMVFLLNISEFHLLLLCPTAAALVEPS